MLKLYNEDCVVGMKRLPDECIDLTVTSPPYDNLRNYDGCVNDFNFELTAQELYRVIKPGGIVVWVVGDATVKGSETGTSFKQALYFKELGFRLHDTMIYQKSGVVFPTVNRYYQNFEYMFVLSKGKPKTVNLIADRKNIWAGYKHTGTNRQADNTLAKKYSTTVGRRYKEYGVRYNVWYCPGGSGKSAKFDEAYKCPAIFPLKLAEDHIRSWSDENDTVLDCFSGSGTTAVACVKLNRHFIGYEINSSYFEIAQRRIDNAYQNGE